MNKWILKSPDKKNVLTVQLNEQGEIIYSLTRKGMDLLLPSRLGLTLEGQSPLISGFSVLNHKYDSHQAEWRPYYGERETIIDHYYSLTLTLEESNTFSRLLEIEFRSYNEGIALKYHIPAQLNLEQFILSAERTQFHFPMNCYAYEEHGAEGEYNRVLISQIKPNCERPLTVEYPHGGYVSITEAGLENYSRMLLSKDEKSPQILVSTLSGLIHEFVGYGLMDEALTGEFADEKVRAQTPFSTPWRVVVVGDRPGDLLENNHLILNLNEPCQIEDPSWIVPGKLLREMTLSVEGAKSCVDYAAKRNFQYIMLDWGWYGDPFDDETYAGNPINRVWFFNKTDRAKNHEINVPEIIKYADSKGIGVVLYIDRRIVENQLDEVLPIYKEWGVKAIKFGFVNTGPQKWTKWLLEAVRKCADFGISVNIHDAYRATGFSRTFPNLLTQEGIRGNEHMPTSRHNATLPFTRFVAGAGDYTICYFTDRKQTTHAHQLAMSVIVYSPMQSIFWYDVPADDQGEPELEFFDVLPTVWDETRVIDGEIGEYVIIARRMGDEWFVGAITNEQERELSFPLRFLDANVPYIAKMYEDDPENQVSRTKVKIRIQEVQSESQIKLNLSANGGQAMHVFPKQEVAANK